MGQWRKQGQWCSHSTEIWLLWDCTARLVPPLISLQMCLLHLPTWFSVTTPSPNVKHMLLGAIFFYLQSFVPKQSLSLYKVLVSEHWQQTHSTDKVHGCPPPPPTPPQASQRHSPTCICGPWLLSSRTTRKRSLWRMNMAVWESRKAMKFFWAEDTERKIPWAWFLSKEIKPNWRRCDKGLKIQQQRKMYIGLTTKIFFYSINELEIPDLRVHQSCWKHEGPCTQRPPGKPGTLGMQNCLCSGKDL